MPLGVSYWSGSALALAFGLATTAQAQTAPVSAGSDSEIIVTAQKRVENVQQVPIAITVVSADQLARRGVQSVQDLSQASASIEFTAPSAAPGGGGFVRGIGTNQIGNATSASSVGIVLDGVVLGNVNISDIFDTERVEVLKGPQGTLFGSSVSAGVVNITTRAPKLGETSGFVNGELAFPEIGSRYFRGALRGAINLPVTDTSALRLSGYMFNNNGMSRDTSNGNKQNQTNFGLRARYLVKLGDRLTANLIGDYSKADSLYPGGLVYRAATPGSQLAQALSACGLAVSASNVDNCAGFKNQMHSQIGGVSAQVDLDLGATALTSVTSYRRSTAWSVANVIGVAPDIARNYLQSCDFVTCSPVVSLTSGSEADPERTRRTLFTQELRLASQGATAIEWVAGLFYQRASFFNRKPSKLIAHPAFLGVDVTLADALGVSAARNEDYAAFGNATYHITANTRLIAGARYTHSRVSESISDPVNTGVSDTYAASVSANALTWRAGVQHDLARHTMAYATISTGYKAPQINDALSTTDRTLDAIAAERPTNYEIGIKHSMLGNRLNISADVFYTRLRNFQTQSCVSATSGILCSNIAVPHLESRGIEWELFGRPVKGMSVSLSGIYNIAKYPSGFLGADQSDLSGRQLNYAPRFKTTLSIEQQFPLRDTLALTVGGDVTIRTKQSMYLSADPIYVVPGQALVNARIGLNGGDKWSLALFARNLTNRIYPTQLYPTSAFAQGGLWQVLDPNSQRTVGLQFNLNF
ncbi:MAG TPA: TonB-dependent receptor [Novosphingobium sp.]|nr:TonB-dependent receptor [Novosphingobium sp.]